MKEKSQYKKNQAGRLLTMRLQEKLKQKALLKNIKIKVGFEYLGNL